ncbi:MAG: hypothetical protein U9N06_03080 [candidate division WOR-3 bacterium]|nr:hypothetical protein [candidate division WOR-3 bacterium]
MPELFIILLSYINLSNIPVDGYYKKNISSVSAMVDGVVASDLYYKEQYLYSGRLVSFRDWCLELFQSDFGNLLTEALQENLKKKGGESEGIIPKIDLSLNVPKGLSYIIGEGGHLSVNGSQEISLDISRNQSSSAIMRETYAFPQIKLEQRLRAMIDGTVGEKIHIAVNHDSEAREKENELKIWYGGDNDDIIQEIHTGDVRGLSGGRNQDVFGIQTSGQFGSTVFNLTAGKLQSNTSSKSEGFSISSDSIELFERSYDKDRYYYIGLSPNDSLISLFLFKESDEINGTPTKLITMNGINLGTTYFAEMTPGDDYEIRYLRLPDGKLSPYLKIMSYHSYSKLGIACTYSDSSGNIKSLGNIPVGGDTLTLIQFRSRSPDPSEPCWNLQMRNVYRFGTSNPTSLNVKIYKVVPGGDDQEIDPQSKKEYVQLLGIDSDGNGIVDPTQVLWGDGCIIFPTAQPFVDPALGKDTVSSIYRKKKLLDEEGKNFRIVIHSASPKKEFYISMGDLVDSSEVITVDKTHTLKRGTDYTIDYTTGRVVFTESANLTPDSKIGYTYDTRPLFTFTSRYIAKTEIKTKPFTNSNLNLNLAFQSSSNPERRPKMGMEPSHISLGKVSFSTQGTPKVLNRIARKLPFVDRDSKSSININSSFGFSLPNPATNGKSYLDDMESVKLSRELFLSAGLWNYCSQPDSSLSINKLGKLDWFNTRIPLRRIYPDLPATQSYQYTSAMVLYFQPNMAISNPEESWAGIMKAFPSEENFLQKKYLEVWVKGDKGELVVELGTHMKEDIPRWGRNSLGADSIIPPNGIIDTEDRNGSFEIDPGEDTGLDGIAFDDDKWKYIPDSLDDGRDDFPDKLETFKDSIKLHRKEGNKRLDSEDLNWDHMLEIQSDFFRYKLDLSSSELVANYGEMGWKMYRIPLTDSTYYEKFGYPSFEKILYSRIWYKGADTTTRIMIASVGIVGSRWKNKGVRVYTTDSLNPSGGKFLITYRNSFENKDYIPPVESERDIYGNYLKEQSLILKIDTLKPNNFCLTESYLELPKLSSGKGYDFRLYKSLRFYSKMTSNADDSIMIFLRLLTDSANYYQFGTYISSEKWDTLDVKFQRFYKLKLDKDSIQGKYSIVGNPTLMNIAYLQFIALNPGSEIFTGEIYLNDITLKEASTEIGSDLNLSVSSNIGNLFPEISYRLTRQSAKYKQNLNELRDIGDRERISHNFGVKISAGEFLNEFLRMPLSFNMAQSSEAPLYKRNSDVFLPKKEREMETASNILRRITFNISRPSSSDKWWLKYTVDNLRISGSYSLGRIFSPENKADTTLSKTVSANYSLPLPHISPLILSGSSSSVFPSDIHFNAAYKSEVRNNYTYSMADSLYKPIVIRQVKEINSGFDFTYRPIRWIDVRYNLSAKTDLYKSNRFGQTVSLSERVTTSHNSSQFNCNTINLSYSNTFTQNHGIEYAKTLGDSLDVRGVSQNRIISINDNLRLNSYLAKLPLVSGFFKNMQPIRFTGTLTRNPTFSYLNSLPDYKFRYGIDLKPTNRITVLNSPSDGGILSRNYNLSSGFSFSKMTLDISGSLRETKPDEINLKNSVSPNKAITFSFPNVSIQIPEVCNYIPPLKKIARTSRLNISINRDSTTNIRLTEQGFSTGKNSLKFSPTLNLRLKNGIDLTVNSGYTKTDNYSNQTVKLHTQNESQDISVTGSYSFKPVKTGIQLPFLGRIKWNNPLNFKVQFSLRNNKGYSINQSTQNKEITQDNRNINFSLTGDYNFSNMVSGDLSLYYRNYLNRKLENEVTTGYGGKFHIFFKF